MWALHSLRLLLDVRVRNTAAEIPEDFAKMVREELVARVAEHLACPRGAAERAALAEVAAALFFSAPNVCFESEGLRDAFLELLSDWRYEARATPRSEKTRPAPSLRSAPLPRLRRLAALEALCALIATQNADHQAGRK